MNRECEFCRDRQEEFKEIGHVCGYCDGTKELEARDCFCCAYEPSECACDADWSDNDEDWEFD